MTPTGSDYLLRLAALSLSFVGFSAIVVTLRRALGAEISDRHLRLVRMYIEGGLTVTALALLPSLLSLLAIPSDFAWRLSSAAAGATFILLLITQMRRRRRIEAGRFPCGLSPSTQSPRVPY